MALSRKITLVAAVVVVVVATYLIYVATTTKETPTTEPTTESKSEYQGIEAELRSGSVCEVIVDLGSVPYSATATKQIRLTNCTEQPIVLLDYETTCRCTWLTLPTTPVAPNSYADVELTFDSRGEFGSVGNYLSITTSDEQCKVAIWMSAEIE